MMSVTAGCLSALLLLLRRLLLSLLLTPTPNTIQSSKPHVRDPIPRVESAVRSVHSKLDRPPPAGWSLCGRTR